jgi:hypothetical protein
MTRRQGCRLKRQQHKRRHVNKKSILERLSSSHILVVTLFLDTASQVVHRMMVMQKQQQQQQGRRERHRGGGSFSSCFALHSVEHGFQEILSGWSFILGCNNRGSPRRLMEYSLALGVAALLAVIVGGPDLLPPFATLNGCENLLRRLHWAAAAFVLF